MIDQTGQRGKPERSQSRQRRNSGCRSIPEGITPQHAISARRPRGEPEAAQELKGLTRD